MTSACSPSVHDLAAPPHSLRHTTVGTVDVLEVVNARLEGTLEATYRVPGIDRAIERVLDEFQPDCVHVQHLLNLSTGLFDAARGIGAPVVVTLHDYWLTCPRDGLRMRADGVLCSNVDHDVCATCLADSPYLVAPVQRGASHAARLVGLGRALHLIHNRAPRLTAWSLRLVRRIWPARAPDLRRAFDDRATHLRERVLQADAILAPTRFARDRALEWGVPRDKLRVLPLGAVMGPLRPRHAGPRRRLG